MSLDEFWAAQDWASLGNMGTWKVDRQGDTVFLAVPARDGESYRVRFRCDGYPQLPPSVKFVDDQGSENNPRAWPRGVGTVGEIVKPPQACFLCTDLTREGLDHHKDWATRPSAWSGNKTLLDVINMIVGLLRSNEYQGRAG